MDKHVPDGAGMDIQKRFEHVLRLIFSNQNHPHTKTSTLIYTTFEDEYEFRTRILILRTEWVSKCFIANRPGAKEE
jgi:hypothetical protein